MGSEVTLHPVYIYVGLAVGVIMLVLSLTPRVASSWQEWLETRRRTAQARRADATARDDADIVELRRQVANLVEWRDATVKRQVEHSAWDRDLYQWAITKGWDGPPPPSLF